MPDVRGRRAYGREHVRHGALVILRDGRCRRPARAVPRGALGSVLGSVGLLRWLRDLSTGELGSGCLDREFRDFFSGRAAQKGCAGAPRPRKKRLVVFFLVLFGVPYAITQLIRQLFESAWLQQEAATSSSAHGLLPLDPGALIFARAHLITLPDTNELALKENDIVVVTVKLNPRNSTEWTRAWRSKGRGARRRS